MKNELARLEEELKVLPCGSLRCTSSRGADQFYVNGNYISKKQMNTVKGIVQREYDEKLVAIIKKRLQIWQQLEVSYASHEIENCFENVCKARRKLIIPAFESVEEKIHKFLEEEYEVGKFDEDNTTEFITLNR